MSRRPGQFEPVAWDGRPAPFPCDKPHRARQEAGMFDLSLHCGMARLTLRRPQARNAIPADQWRPLGALTERAVEQGARMLILKGEGDAFCAGADLKDFGRMHVDPEAATAFREAM